MKTKFGFTPTTIMMSLGSALSGPVMLTRISMRVEEMPSYFIWGKGSSVGPTVIPIKLHDVISSVKNEKKNIETYLLKFIVFFVWL